MIFARHKSNIIVLCLTAVLLFLVYWVGSYGTEPVPVMNEICTVNFSVAADQGGSYLDYLELYNPYDEDYSMDGLWLSNDKDEPQRFDMTGIVVPAHGYAVIWMMDEEDLPEVVENLEEAMSTDVVDMFEMPTTLDCPQYYCTFDVPRKGGYLYVSNSDSKIIESVTVPALSYNVAYGRTTDGGADLAGMEPTPGASNDGAEEIVLDKAEDPVLSAESGFYEESFELSISHALGTEVYYTRDGSIPTVESMHYEESILIDDASDNPNVYAARDDIYPGVYIPEETVDKAVVVRAIAVDSLTGGGQRCGERHVFCRVRGQGCV